MSALASNVAPSTRRFFHNTFTETTALFLNFLTYLSRIWNGTSSNERSSLTPRPTNKKNRLRINNTLFKHGKMINLMNRSQFTWKFQFIGIFTNPLQDFIESHIARTQLPFLDKSNYLFHWWNTQIHFVTFFKLQISSPIIGIILFLTIGCLQPIRYDMKSP